MVTKYSTKSIMKDEEGLPPISEAWWESILTDEEVEAHSFSSRYPPIPVEDKQIPVLSLQKRSHPLIGTMWLSSLSWIK